MLLYLHVLSFGLSVVDAFPTLAKFQPSSKPKEDMLVIQETGIALRPNRPCAPALGVHPELPILPFLLSVFLNFQQFRESAFAQ
jgi:hypothetical protein